MSIENQILRVSMNQHEHKRHAVARRSGHQDVSGSLNNVPTSFSSHQPLLDATEDPPVPAELLRSNSKSSRHALLSRSRSARHSESGSRHEPLSAYTLISALSATSHSLKRKKSSGSASTSTAVTARSTFEDEQEILMRHKDPAYIASFTHCNRSYVSLRRSRTSPEQHIEEPTAEMSNSGEREYRTRDKGKAVDRPHSSHSSRRHMESAEYSRDKLHDRTERHLFSGPLAQAEFDRMRKEIEHLKKTAHDAKKMVKKQAKKIEELKAHVLAETAAREEQEARLQTLKNKCDKNEELITHIEQSLQCQICMDLIHRPFALSPCGHILCLHCLQEWFRKAPSQDDDDPDDVIDDPDYILTRPKSCPCCRAVVTRRPVPVFLVKAVTTALTKSRAVEGRARSPSPIEDDPWKGLFMSSDEEEEEFLDSSDEDDRYEDAVGWALQGLQVGLAAGMGGVHHRRYAPFRFDSSSSSESDEDEDDDEEGEAEEDPEAQSLYHDGESDSDESVYIPARWEPPSVTVEPESYAGHIFWDEEDEAAFFNMLRRGCTEEMIQTFEMEYTHRRGLVAHVHSLEELYGVAEEYQDDDGDYGEKNNRIFLGWNIKLNEADGDGEVYMQWVLNDVKQNPRRWECAPRANMPGCFDVKRMARQEDAEEYDTTDTEVWLDANDRYV
ncbi:hypothetical protein Hypma_003663 [Hypsizygus marmoreus]|uniref:RING-type domain-containing protein n=1 Tax=Hypsizygus marmoreus TaxID=39966 RepID=A0A369J5X0_HYPMA|nr:hypothetical protein Hypma_003663 [Hypsizygus marmoreus]